MKYIVELKFTNPAHEHVSLRRRVDTTTRIVEASSEEEAINRASKQQSALGFMIKEAKIIVQETQAPTPVKHISESKDEMKDMEDKDDEEEEDEEEDEDEDEDEDEEKGEMKEGIVADVLASRREKAQKKIADMILKRDMAATKKEREEKRQAGTMKPFKEEAEIQYIEEKLTASDSASKWISDFVASDNPKFAGKSKKERIQMALGAHYAAKRAAKNEEVKLVDEAKGEPPAEFMPSDTKLPKIKVPAKPKPGVRKRGPVGSFNKKGVWNDGVREEVVAEAVDPGKTRVVNKKVKTERAAERLVKAIKGKVNKVVTEPSIDVKISGVK